MTSRSPYPIAGPRVLLAAATLAISACGSGAIAPNIDLGELRLELAMPSALAADDTASLVIRLWNDGARPVRFMYQSRCHLAFRIADAATGAPVFDGADGWQCGADLSGLSIPAGSFRAVAVVLHAVSPMPGHFHGLHLEAGEYDVVAQVAARGDQVESPPLRMAAY